jgi:hypothetical protein
MPPPQPGDVKGAVVVSTVDHADAEVFQQWRASKVAQWKSGESQYLCSKFATLAELDAWLQRKGAEAHVKTQQQRNTNSRPGGGSVSSIASASASVSVGGFCGSPLMLVVVIAAAAIALITVLAGIATRVDGGSHAAPAVAFVRKTERTSKEAPGCVGCVWWESSVAGLLQELWLWLRRGGRCNRGKAVLLRGEADIYLHEKHGQRLVVARCPIAGAARSVKIHASTWCAWV